MAVLDFLRQMLGGNEQEANSAVAAQPLTQPWLDKVLSGEMARQGLEYYNQNPMEAALGFTGGGLGTKAYHYSPNEFARFNLDKAGSVTDPGMMGRALYFSTDPAVAAAGPHRYEVNLDIKSPLNIQHPPDYRTATKSDLAGAALDLTPPTKGALAIGKQSPTLPEWQQWSQSVADAAKARGHDAAVLDYSPTGYPHQEIAVYDPGIIEILRKFGLLPPVAAGGLLAAPGMSEAAQ